MKKFVLIIMLVAILAALCSCGQTTSISTNTHYANNTIEEKYIEEQFIEEIKIEEIKVNEIVIR